MQGSGPDTRPSGPFLLGEPALLQLPAQIALRVTACPDPQGSRIGRSPIFPVFAAGDSNGAVLADEFDARFFEGFAQGCG
jgi:hypothetical protein